MKTTIRSSWVMAFAVALSFAATLFTTTAHADDWGTLTGRFVYDGKAPTAQPINITKEPEICGKHPLYDEGLVVDGSGGLANVFIWVRGKDVKVGALVCSHSDGQKGFG